MESILSTSAQLTAVQLATSEADYDNAANHVVAALKKLSAPEPAVAATLLQTTDANAHTIPYFFLLASLIDSTLSAHKSSRSLPASLLPDGDRWPLITNALLNFDAVQIRYAGSQLVRVVEIVFHGAEQSSNFVPAIQLLSSVILNLDPSSSTLSVSHFYYLRLCLYAQAYLEALPILDLPIYHIPTQESTKSIEKRLSSYPCSRQESSVAWINTSTSLSGKITTRVYLEYYFMGALCYIATKQWKKAQAFLEVVLICPTHQNVASLIMLEAYRKWVLIGLITEGNIPHAPRAMSGSAIKHIRTLAKPYECVADAFKTGNLETLATEIEAGNDFWQVEGNYGLLIEVVDAFRKFSIIKLGKTFAALPIEDVAKKAAINPDDVQGALAYVQTLVESGSLQAQIIPSQKGSLGTVRFLPSTAARKSETEIEGLLASKTRELRTLMKHISDYDYQIEVNKDYLDWLLRAKRARDQEKKAGNASGNDYPIGRPPPADFHDEEMMDDY